MPSVDPWIGPRGSAVDRVLWLIRERGPLTRAEVAARTGMSVSGVRPLIASLVADGLVLERSGQRGTNQGRGRPGNVLLPVVPDGVVLGLDFGHAHVSVAVADLAGEHLVHERRAVDVDRHASDALAAASDLALALLRRSRRAVTEVRGVVAGVPGPVDRDGHIRSSTIVASWWDLPIAHEIASRLDVQAGIVDVLNDAHLGALGEHRRGAARGCSEFIYVKASHGLGTGLVLGGRLYRGSQGLAGELGHAVVEPEGELCRCGGRGCLETVVSVQRVRERIGYVTGGDDFELSRADEEHPAARRVVLEAGRHLGRTLAEVCNLLDPQRIVLGGELAAAGRPLVEGVAESVRRYAQPAVGEVSVVLSELGEMAQVAGATGLAAAQARERGWARSR